MAQIEVFAEDLSGKDCVIFRSGPKARRFWWPYGYACMGVKNSPSPGEIEMKALVAPWRPFWLHWLFLPFSGDHVKVCFDLARSMGYEPKFERAKRAKDSHGL